MPSELRTPLIVGGSVVGCGAVIAVVVLWTWLFPAPPTTTYTDASGETVTVSWEDYPGLAGEPAAQLLAGPTEAEVLAAEDAVIAELQDAFGAWDLGWEEQGDPGWFGDGGNGYGGESARISYNGITWTSDALPPSEAWPELMERLDGAAQRNGFGELLPEWEQPWVADEEEYFRQLAEERGGDDPEHWWLRSYDAYHEGLWLFVTVTDPSRPGAPEDAEAGVTMMVGATTVPDDEREDVERRLEPFLGLDMPPATTSD